MDGWGKVKTAAKYAGVSERTLRTWLKQGLRHAKLPSGIVLIKYDFVAEFLSNYGVKDGVLDGIVDDVLRDLSNNRCKTGSPCCEVSKCK